MNNSIVVQNWYSTTKYAQYDLTAGINISDTSYYGPLYVSTVKGNIGNNPSGQFIYAINQYSRTDDIASINIAYTGTAPNFARGSLYSITGLPDDVMNATGMILNVQPNGGSSITLQFINPGPEESAQSTSLGAINAPEPSWTTGFFFTPGYSSPYEVQQAVINAQFEPGYSQRQPQGLDANTSVWTLGFENRTNKEARAILAYVQNLQGVYATTLMIPPTSLYNNPTLKYVLSNPKESPGSYNLNNISVAAKQVFEY